ncbi:hypothetical protein Tco_0902298 [Tanacetum coccineum]
MKPNTDLVNDVGVVVVISIGAVVCYECVYVVGFEKQLLEGKGVLVDNDGKPLKNYSGVQGSEDEVGYIDNEMTSNLAVGYGTKTLLEQCRETYVNADYDPYDDDMQEGREIQSICDSIQSICDTI